MSDGTATSQSTPLNESIIRNKFLPRKKENQATSRLDGLIRAGSASNAPVSPSSNQAMQRTGSGLQLGPYSHASTHVQQSASASPRLNNALAGRGSILAKTEVESTADRPSTGYNRQSPNFPTVRSPLLSPAYSRTGSASGTGSLRLQSSNPGTLTALIHHLFTPRQGYQVARGTEPTSPFIQTLRAPASTPMSAIISRPVSSIGSKPPAAIRASSNGSLIPTPPSTVSPKLLVQRRRVSVSCGGTPSLAVADPSPANAIQTVESPPRALIIRETVHEEEPFLVPTQTSMPQLPTYDNSDLYDLYDGPHPVHHKAISGFLIGREIGDGGFGTVRIGCCLANDERIAVKVVDKRRLENPDDEMLLKREIRAMKHVHGHPSIINMFGSFETDDYIYIIMDYLKGGTLLDFVKRKKTLSKTEASRFLRQAAESLKHCHLLSVVHRDVKLENMMLDADDNLKLIDFGLCAFFRPGQRLKVFCGSPSYAAPEIVSLVEYEGPPVDVWSLGVCFYAMVVGYLPFYNSKGKTNLQEKILSGQYTLPDYIQQSSVKSLIEGMLTVDPAKRMTLDEVLAHPWLKTYSERRAAATFIT